MKIFKKNPPYIVYEYTLLKKILFIVLPLLILSIIYSNYLTFIRHNVNEHQILYETVIAINAVFLSVVISISLKLLIYLSKKDFIFYCLKGYCKIIDEEEDIFAKMNFLFLAIDSYNKYLKKKIKYEIRNIEKINSNIMILPLEKRNHIIESVCESINNEDNLKMARVLSELIDVPKTDSLFVHYPLKQKLKVVATFLTVAIPIIISLIQLIQLVRNWIY
jgi:hypothetical protein